VHLVEILKRYSKGKILFLL